MLKALAEDPDYVGFRVRYTEAGVRQQPVIHSLACGGWYDHPSELKRDICYFNPTRLELARKVRFRGPYCDVEWGDDLRGIIKTEVFIDDEVFYYQRDSRQLPHPAQPHAGRPDPAAAVLPVAAGNLMGMAPCRPVPGDDGRAGRWPIADGHKSPHARGPAGRR